MMFEAVKSRDYPLLQGGFLLFTVGVLITNLVTDWLYGRLDPRVRQVQ
jgi:peptide/nickel transport system permease protein